ncbi:unnamed protein product, partial [Iphiclides podalirius]
MSVSYLKRVCSLGERHQNKSNNRRVWTSSTGSTGIRGSAHGRGTGSGVRHWQGSVRHERAHHVAEGEEDPSAPASASEGEENERPMFQMSLRDYKPGKVRRRWPARWRVRREHSVAWHRLILIMLYNHNVLSPN